jgi:hypothetical protein
VIVAVVIVGLVVRQDPKDKRDVDSGPDPVFDFDID